MSERSERLNSAYEMVLADLRWRRELIDEPIQDLEQFWLAKEPALSQPEQE